MPTFLLTPGELTLADIRQLQSQPHRLELSQASETAVSTARATVDAVIAKGEPSYGINTGFGLLAQTRISDDELKTLQANIVTSHAAGCGEPLADDIVKLILLLKINSLARGFSGISLTGLQALIDLYNHEILPIIPSKGSVGASGDLAPLAHLSLTLMGLGECRYKGQTQASGDALKASGLAPYTLQAKEGLSLLNGTQVSTALALHHGLYAQHLLDSATIIGAMSVDAAMGSDTPFDARIHDVRGHTAQATVAKRLRSLLAGSEIRHSHHCCERVQDPYSLRCQPQVLGACQMHLSHALDTLMVEANGVTDNPLVFSDGGDILSGGNFHAEPVAISADLIAICLCEIASIAERRIALLIDPHHNQGLPAFLVNEPGVNSGFMLAHVTASALVSENKTLAHPASVDSLPTSANQEDHVSMATFAGRRLGDIASNVAEVLAIELLAAAQGLDFRLPLKTSEQLQHYWQTLRQAVPFYDKDRYFAPDIRAAKGVINTWHVSRP
jgi:histidine ammonia-lyase